MTRRKGREVGIKREKKENGGGNVRSEEKEEGGGREPMREEGRGQRMGGRGD